jgi:Na+-transporting NADH:ubiquinone oxidoreductase subunit NqrC
MDLDLLSLIPAGGVAGTLVIVIIYLMRQNNHLMRQNTEDRQHYMLTIAGVRVEIAELKEVNAKVILELDAERRKRWEAEDKAASYRRKASITGDDVL